MTSVAAAAAGVLSGSDVVLVERGTTLKTFTSGNDVFTLLLTGFCKILVKQCSASQLATGR